jgi:putative transposase
VEQDGHGRDLLVQRRRVKSAANKVFRERLQGLTYGPRVLSTDKLKRYGAAQREMWPGVDHRPHRSLNHRAANPHQPTGQRQRHMPGLKAPGHAQRVRSA